MSYNITVNGSIVGSDTRTFSGSGWITSSRTGNNYSVRVEGGAYPATTGATALASATVPAQASVCGFDRYASMARNASRKAGL